MYTTVRSFVEGYIQDHGDETWWGPVALSDSECENSIYYAAWMLVPRDQFGGIHRIEVMNHIMPIGYLPEFYSLPAGDIYLAFLPVKTNHYKTETVLRSMFHDSEWVPYYKDGAVNSEWLTKKVEILWGKP